MSTVQAPLSHAPSCEEIARVIAAHDGIEGALLPILHGLQDAFGHVPAAAVDLLAGHLNLSRAEIAGVISFYPDFREAPAGRHVVKICRAEACQAMGGAALADHALARAGVAWHGTTADGAVTIEPVYCLGLCACAPAAMVDGRVHGRLTPARMDALLKETGA